MSKPICQTCVHCRPSYYGNVYCSYADYTNAYCALTDLVSLSGRGGKSCTHTRGPNGPCGSDGALYEAKPEPKPEPQIIKVEAESRPWWRFW